MAPLTRRRCLYEEGGCAWQVPQCNQISTTAEAELYVRSHSTSCIYNPAVVQETQRRPDREAVETACRRAAKDKVGACRWVAKDKTEACRCEDEAEVRRVEAKDRHATAKDEAGKQDYWRQRVAEESREAAITGQLPLGQLVHILRCQDRRGTPAASNPCQHDPRHDLRRR